MQAERWRQIEDLFQAAIAEPPENRAAFLAEACRGDVELQREVESLLNQQADSFLEGSPAAYMPSKSDDGRDPAPESGGAPGLTIGPYELVEIIGQGGMGEVWLAEQKQPVRRRVALKLIKKGMDTHEVVARFESERRALALMDHPAIAKVFEAGSTLKGQPYFVMEFVEGMPISDFCDKHKLATRARLELFIQVCEGVQHAHQKAIIHRDLKPSNVLVAEVDGKAAPKIIDFGVAKATAQRLTAETMFTRVGAVVGTPAYMSPEQANSLIDDVDTRTDVYSLGVMLYELLVGALPFDFHNLRFDEIVHKLHEEDAAKPSTKLRTLGKDSTETARNRCTEPKILARLLSGDLDAITLRAIEKERSRRYGSPSDLGADIKRYLDNEPVLAHAPSLRYKAGKYVRRHRLGLSVSACAVLLLASFAVAQAYALRRVTIERDRADRRLTEIVALANKSLLDVHFAIQRLPGATEARRQIVTTTLDYLQTLEKDEGNDHDLQLVLAGAYLRMGQIQGSPFTASLGDSAGAMKSYLRAAEWLRPLLRVRPRDPEVLSVWIDIQSGRAELLNVRGRHDEEAGLLLGALPFAATLSQVPDGDGGGREANVHQMLVSTLQSDHPDKAIEHAHLAAEGFRKVLVKHPDDLDSVNALAAVNSLWAATLLPTDPGGALMHYRESARLREALVRDHPNNSAFRRGLMIAYRQIAGALGDSFLVTPGHDAAGARGYYLKAEGMAQELAAADPANRTAKYDLAFVELRIGALDPAKGGNAESLARLQKARAMFDELLKTDPHSVRYLSSLGLAHEYIGIRLRALGKTAQALEELETSLVFADKVLAVNGKDLQAAAQGISAEQEIANLLAAKSDRNGAVNHLSRSVARAERFSDLSGTPASQILLARAYGAVAAAHKSTGEWPQAREAAAHSVLIWSKVIGGRNDDVHAPDLARTNSLIAECDSHLH